MIKKTSELVIGTPLFTDSSGIHIHIETRTGYDEYGRVIPFNVVLFLRNDGVLQNLGPQREPSSKGYFVYYNQKYISIRAINNERAES
jgi:hypothetical protein